MNFTTIIIITLIVIIIIAAVAFGIYKAGFRTTKVKVKTGLLEAEMERTPTGDKDDKAEEPVLRTKASQEATDGGVIRKSTIKASADSGVEAIQKAEGEGSRVDDSRIELD